MNKFTTFGCRKDANGNFVNPACRYRQNDNFVSREFKPQIIAKQNVLPKKSITINKPVDKPIDKPIDKPVNNPIEEQEHIHPDVKQILSNLKNRHIQDIHPQLKKIEPRKEEVITENHQIVPHKILPPFKLMPL
jgi:hypothetical protein